MTRCGSAHRPEDVAPVTAYRLVGPIEVVDGILVIAYRTPYDGCVRNCTSAHTWRISARYQSLAGSIDVFAERGTPSHAGDRVAVVHGDPLFGNQGSQRRIYEVTSF